MPGWCRARAAMPRRSSRERWRRCAGARGFRPARHVLLRGGDGPRRALAGRPASSGGAPERLRGRRNGPAGARTAPRRVPRACGLPGDAGGRSLAGGLCGLRGGAAGGARLRPRPGALRGHRRPRGAGLGLAAVRAAVTREAGEPWRERLLALPGFLSGAPEFTPSDIRDGLALTGHFLARHIAGPVDRPLPAARLRLADCFAG